MEEVLIYTVYVSIDMPDINRTSAAYSTVLNERIKRIEEVFQTLPDDWEYELVRKIPE